MKHPIGKKVMDALEKSKLVVFKDEFGIDLVRSEEDHLVALIERESGVERLTDALRWALTQINHVDISGDGRDGPHHREHPNCNTCDNFQNAKRTLKKFEGNDGQRRINPTDRRAH